eukprot:8203960-Pyramimonas_sp.AAC.1
MNSTIRLKKPHAHADRVGGFWTPARGNEATIRANGPPICSYKYRVLGIAFGGAPYGAAGVARMNAGTYAAPATRAFGGAPCGATKRIRGVPKRP